jgi:pantoate--beta-alanine ligase
MDVHREIESFREARRDLEGTVGFVPTLGAIHEGHVALMDEVRRRVDHLVVSIFVNPTQFEPGSDYEAYPRELERDCEKCDARGCSIVFAPTEDEMYHDDHATTVSVTGLTDVLCGPQRPGHFEGVTTIVAKLFNIVEPDVAAFGEKDYQQLAIIRRMVRDLNLPVEIVGVPTVREADGLAVSSRNDYLEGQQRRDAVSLSRALARAWHDFQEGVRDGDELVERARAHLLEYASVDEASIDYVECVHPETLRPYEGAQRSIGDEGVVMAMAVQIGEARLIDNLRLDGPLPDELEEG